MSKPNTLIDRLIDIATGKIKHLNAGRCPTSHDHNQTDYQCPACRIIVAAKRSAREEAISENQAVGAPVYYRYSGTSVTGLKEELVLLVHRSGVTFSHDGWQKSAVTVPKDEITPLVSKLLDASDALENLDRVGYIPHKN